MMFFICTAFFTIFFIFPLIWPTKKPAVKAGLMEVPSGFEPENKGFAEQLLRKERFIFYTRFDKYMDSDGPRKSFTPL